MTLSVIAAVSENDVIGRQGGLPWRLPDDLRRFKKLTWGHPIIMGRRTYESIGRPLPGRANVVLTRDRSWSAPGVVVAHSLEEALERCRNADEVFAIGGDEVFRLALPAARKLYLTRVHASIEGDVSFPPAELERWRLVSEERHPADESHDHAFTFLVYERP